MTVRRMVVMAVVRVIVRVLPDPIEVPNPESSALQAEIDRYEPGHPALELVVALGWALWFVALTPAWFVVGVLDRTGFGPWLRGKLGTGL